MTDAIKSQERVGIQQREALKRRQNAEINVLQDNHQNQKAETKKAQNQEVVDLRDEHERHLNQETIKKDKVLSGMKDHVNATQKMTDKQLRELKERDQTQKAVLQDRAQDDRQRIMSEQEAYLTDANDRFSTESKKVLQNGKSNVENIKSSLGQQYSDEKNRMESRMNLQRNDLTAQYKQQGDQHKIAQNAQVDKHKKDKFATNIRQQSDLGKLVNSHNHQLKLKDDDFRKGLKEQDVFYEQRYVENLKTNNDKLQGLEDLHVKVLDKMKAGLTKEIEARVIRSDDSFYQFTEMRPVMKTFPDRIEITVKVPEHSKQDLQLSTNNKQAILTFNRRFKDSQTNLEGTVNKIDKVETLSTRLTADAVLNPKKVTSSYEGGEMKYIIPKA